MNEAVENYWRGVESRSDAVLDEIRELWALISKPMTQRNRDIAKSKIRNLDEINSSNYRECESLVAELKDDEIVHRDDIPEVMKYIPPATRLSQRDVSELVDALKDWREKIGLPREAY